jgi:hypothetical protein
MTAEPRTSTPITAGSTTTASGSTASGSTASGTTGLTTTGATPAGAITAIPGALSPTLGLIPALYVSRRGVQPQIRLRHLLRRSH